MFTKRNGLFYRDRVYYYRGNVLYGVYDTTTHILKLYTNHGEVCKILH